jgi:uncharacterized protein YndB with AHSA1/START domain
MARTQIIAEPGVPQIVVSREFDAPRDLVARAHTDPDLLVQWLGPRDLNMTIDRFDLRDGGRWRFVHWDIDGNEYGFHGVFHGPPSPGGIVWTFEFEGTPGRVAMETATFEELGGVTLLTQNVVFQSVEDRDRELQSGMAEGALESMDRLEELLARLALVS